MSVMCSECQPNDFVCCASELELFKDIGAIEVLQSLFLLLYVKAVSLKDSPMYLLRFSDICHVFVLHVFE